MKHIIILIGVCLPFPLQAQNIAAFFEQCPQAESQVTGPTQNDWDSYAAGLIGLPLWRGASQRTRDFHEAGRQRLPLEFIKPRCPTESERNTYGALAIAECFLGAGGLGKHARNALEYARQNLRLSPYSDGLCIKAGTVPFALRVVGGESH